MSKTFVVAFISQETLFQQKKCSCVFSRRRRSEKHLPEVQQELRDQQIDYMMYMTDSNKNTQQTDHVWVQEFRQKPICLWLTKSASGSCKSQWNVVGPRCRLDLPPTQEPRIPVAFLPASRVRGLDLSLESVGGEGWKMEEEGREKPSVKSRGYNFYVGPPSWFIKQIKTSGQNIS